MSFNAFNLSRLRTAIRPFRLHWFSRLRSTNDHAALLRKRGELFPPAIVPTGNQAAGRGRNTNTWWSGPGGLTVTFVLPIDEDLSPHQLPLIAGLAARNAVVRLSGDDSIQLKWPNDLLYQGRKLAGLLCERVHKADLIGLGLNVNQDADVPRDLRRQIAWLESIRGQRLDKTAILIESVKHLNPMLSRRKEYPFARILREYDMHHALVGRGVTVNGHSQEPALRGLCQGLDSMGRLLLRSGGRLHRVIAGQV